MPYGLKLTVIVLSMTAFLNAITFPLQHINDKQLSFKATQAERSPLKIGKSGFVIRQYQDLEYIQAIATITAISNHKITAKIFDHNPLAKENLPHLKAPTVAKNSKIVFDLFDKNAMIIAPNKTAFKTIQKNYPKRFLSPDLILTKLDGQLPNKKNLQAIAKDYHIGSIYLSLGNRLYVLDPFSLKVMASHPLELTDTSYKKPFFSYMEKKSIASFFDKFRTFDYKAYYTTLINTNKN